MPLPSTSPIRMPTRSLADGKHVTEVPADQLGMIGRLRHATELEAGELAQRMDEVLLQRGRHPLYVVEEAGVLQRLRQDRADLAGEVDLGRTVVAPCPVGEVQAAARAARSPSAGWRSAPPC